MAETVALNLPNKVPELEQLTLNNWKSGVVTLISESNLAPTMLKEAINIFLYEKGLPGPRWGSNWFGSAMPNGMPIDGAAMYQSAAFANQLVAVAGGVVYQSLNNGVTWTQCTGASLTSGKKCYFEQGSTSSTGQNFMYITNGYDYPIRYDGSTTLQAFVAIGPPSGLTVTPTSLTTNTNYDFYYRVSAVNAVGVTQATASTKTSVQAVRAAWDPTNTGSHYVTLAWTAVAGAVRYDIYICDNATDDAANNLSYLSSVGATASPNWIDNGQTVPNPSSTVPIQNTTGAPRIRELTAVGSRLYGVQDRDFPYRVWFTGSGPYVGYFADAYDGGYIDLQRGSQFYPIKVADYRDGKGTPLATIWCDSADTRGCIWQMSLQTTTVLNTQFTQPNANKLPGSRGTSAPNSVVNVLNDYMFFNYQAMYNVGSRAQFLNLLSTDEATANIRPTLTQNISPANVPNTCAFYYLGKVFVSASFNSTTNNQTMVLDTERKAWIPAAYNFGMERMFQYTDITKQTHLMFWKPGDKQLSETSSSIDGDYGSPFDTSLTTGLYPTQKDRFAFMYVEDMEVEFSQPAGGIRVELVGIERNRGYATQKTINVTATTSSTNVGWDTFAWDTTAWDDTTVSAVNYSEASTKRYGIVQRDLNAYQFHVSTSGTFSSFTLNALQIEGSPTNAGMPPKWRVTAT